MRYPLVENLKADKGVLIMHTTCLYITLNGFKKPSCVPNEYLNLNLHTHIVTTLNSDLCSFVGIAQNIPLLKRDIIFMNNVE